MIASTEYILAEDVDFQLSYDSEQPVIVFKGTDQHLTAYSIEPDDQTSSRDIVLALVDGAYTTFLPGVL